MYVGDDGLVAVRCLCFPLHGSYRRIFSKFCQQSCAQRALIRTRINNRASLVIGKMIPYLLPL
jgi:hypothetical protein